MNYLVDTNVVAEFVRPRPDTTVMAWVNTLDRFAVSVITLEEVFFGLAARPHPKVEAFLDGFFARYCEVLPVTDAVARQAGKLRGQFKAAGITRSQADMLIAATAASRGLTVATRNEKDFQGCGVPVLNPFR